MSASQSQNETHLLSNIGWLRAAVLGANDGIVSTASLIAGVAAAPSATPSSILIAGVAGLVAGALSMAAGEYVSVSSQADTEAADLNRERKELEADPAFEKEELTNIYVGRGVDRDLATKVAEQLMAKDALGAHARDELHMSAFHEARPIQAAFASAGAFGIGAALPLVIAIFSPQSTLIAAVTAGSLICLAILGVLGARAGRANIWVGALRVTFWGAIAMIITALIGRLTGSVI